jgi:hypothetical protein
MEMPLIMNVFLDTDCTIRGNGWKSAGTAIGLGYELGTQIQPAIRQSGSQR